MRVRIIFFLFFHTSAKHITCVCSFQAAPCERSHSRISADDTETDEASFSGQDDTSSNFDILEWAKVCLLCFLGSFYVVSAVIILLTL